MSANLHEFVAMAGLVSISTFFVVGFRYAIASWERSAEEETRRRQPEWDAQYAKAKKQSRQ